MEEEREALLQMQRRLLVGGWVGGCRDGCYIKGAC
jgi:hypothetical protein